MYPKRTHKEAFVTQDSDTESNPVALRKKRLLKYENLESLKLCVTSIKHYYKEEERGRERNSKG